MEAAETDLIARRAKLARDINGAGKLVRLHPDDADQRPPAPALEVADDPAREHPAIGLVIGVDLDPDARAQNLALAGVLGQAVHAGERVGRQRRAEPLDRIAVVVVMRRLDENEGEQRVRRARIRLGLNWTRRRPHQLVAPQKNRRTATTERLIRANPWRLPQSAGADHMGGTRPSLPTRTKPASIEPSSCLGPRAMIAAPGLRSVCAPGSKATIGVFGSTTMVCSPPL